MPPARSPKRTQARRSRHALLDALDAAETKRLLATLLDAHPELVAEAADLADAQLGPLTLEEAAALAVETWRKRGRGRSTTGARAKEWATMRSFVTDSLPEWRSFLTQALGRRPTAGRKQSKRR